MAAWPGGAGRLAVSLADHFSLFRGLRLAGDGLSDSGPSVPGSSRSFAGVYPVGNPDDFAATGRVLDHAPADGDAGDVIYRIIEDEKYGITYH